MIERRRKRLGDMLLEAGLITKEQELEAVQIQSETNMLFGQILTEKGYVNESQIIALLEQQLGIPHLLLSDYYIDPAVPPLIPETLAKKYDLIPVKKEGSRLIVAMTDPMNIFAIDDVQLATGLIVEPAIATNADVARAIGLYYGKQKAEHAINEYQKEREQNFSASDDIEDAESLQNAPIVRLVNTIINQAVRSAASDIHIEPFEDEVFIRIRIDGNLQKILTFSKSTHAAIVARIKIMSGLDIAEKRQPQDGRFESVVEGERIDFRISVLPTIFGEKIVIRLLNRDNTLILQSKFGFSDYNYELFSRIIKSPVGIVLITGPTGSGKSTSLYAVLEKINTAEKNIITVEDPVEYMIKGISQVQVNPKAGMTFSNSLSSILRQDPDIIMVGELRDSQTVEIAVRAAITGHMVLSTMHTNDTASTVTRLVDMGVEPFLVSTAVVGIVAQRLVRKICVSCKREFMADDSDLAAAGIPRGTKTYKGNGCVTCRNTGYKGRTAVHEVLPVTRRIRKLIASGADADVIRESALEEGMRTLKQSCAELVVKGITTVDEAVRVAYNVE